MYSVGTVFRGDNGFQKYLVRIVGINGDWYFYYTDWIFESGKRYYRSTLREHELHEYDLEEIEEEEWFLAIMKNSL